MTEAEKERAAIVALITRYGEELIRAIDKTPDGPLKLHAMGEFSAAHTIRNAIARLEHLQKEKGNE